MTMVRDFVYAYRILRKSPVTTAVTILALALGIGANIGSFTSINAIVLHPFAYPDLDRIMTVWGAVPKAGQDRSGVSPADFEDWRRQNRSFERLSAYENWPTNLTEEDRPQPVQGVRVAADYFDVFGMKPSIGRTFTAREAESEGARVAIVSDTFWRTRFAAASDVIGKTIELAGQSYTIVGVMPEDFDHPLAADVWAPISLTAEEKADRVSRTLLVVGRLRRDVSAPQADAEIRAIAASLARDYPKSNEGWSATVTPLSQIANRETNRFIEVLFVASLFLLLLAGANVANIQLAQAMNRRKTIVIEASLGASRFRIARSLCAQSLLLAGAGGALALVAAFWMGDINRASLPAMVYRIIPGLRQSHIDSTVVSFTVGLSLLTGVLCSLPAIIHLLSKGSGLALTEALRQGDRSVAGDLRHRMRDLLVIGEIAMALVLLLGAGVMVSTFQHMLKMDLGYNASNLLTAQVSLAKRSYKTDAQITDFFNRLMAEASAIPNVESASVEMPGGTASDLRIEGQPGPTAEDPKPEVRIVDAHYFQTMKIPMVAGRAIAEQDTFDATPVVVLSKSIAQHYWPKGDSLGHRIRFGQSPWLTIVGVAGDTLQWFTHAPEPVIYGAYPQKPIGSGRVLLRTSGDPMLAASAITAKARAIDSKEPLFEVMSMEQTLSEQRSGVEGSARVMENNGLIALFLALTGIYGVISYLVSQQTREIGIRIAVGADRADILKMTLGEAFRLAGIGLAIGVPMAYLLTRALSNALYGVIVIEWTTFASVTALLAFAALVAAYVPARRAASVDPVTALRTM